MARLVEKPRSTVYFLNSAAMVYRAVVNTVEVHCDISQFNPKVVHTRGVYVI